MPRDLGKTYVMVNIPDYTLTLVQRRQGLLEDQDRGRQAGQADAAAQRGDEVHHRQSDLERAAVDHRERISAGAAAGPAGARAHRAQGRAEPRRHHPHLPAAGRPATRSAASASTSPTSSWSTSTTRRTSTCSPHDKRAYSHGCMRVQNPLKYGEMLLSLVARSEHYTAARLAEDVRRHRDQHQLPDEHPGPPDLSDRLRGRRRQAAIPRRRLRPRRQDDRDPQGQRAQGRRHRHRAAAGHFVASRCACRSACMAAAAAATTQRRASSTSCSAARIRRRSRPIGARPPGSAWATTDAISSADRGKT